MPKIIFRNKFKHIFMFHPAEKSMNPNLQKIVGVFRFKQRDKESLLENIE